MKNILIIIALFAAADGFGQKPLDSIFASDVKMLTKFFPGSERGFPNATYQLSPEAFLDKLDSFKNFGYASADSLNDAHKKDLRRKDIDAFSRMMLSMYKQDYGADSVKTEQYYNAISNSDNSDTAHPISIDSLFQARFTKKLSDSDSHTLDSLIYSGMDLTDSALFASSTAHRRMVEMKLRKIEAEKYSDSTEDQGMFTQRMLDEVLMEGHVFEHFSYENWSFILNSGKDSGAIARAYQQYMSKARDAALRKKAETEFGNFKAVARNAVAPNFSYHDINGKMVSLKQLKGKYVYIDVWATWCGPCKMEIPHLAKLEEEYAKKNIHFVSLSVDNQKDRAAWENYVKSNHLSGIQVMADKDFESDFIKKFNITYIPRFILIDPAGKIVDANALRPSDKGLRMQFDELL